MGYQSRQYLLEEDITLSGIWTPVGISSDTNAFHGKFYGNGKTITFYGDFAAGLGNYGIFGCAQNAVIRDLVVEFANSISVSAAIASNTGGIVGWLANSSVYTSFSTGNVKIDSNTTFAARAGGIYGTNQIDSGSHIVTNSVVLGESITATAGSLPSANINAYRIGYKGSLPFNLNYALDTGCGGTVVRLVIFLIITELLRILRLFLLL